MRCFNCGKVMRSGAVGWPDFLIFPKGGAPIALEAKEGTGRQSPEQKAWQSVLEASGIRYFVVHSVEEAAKIVR
jgi:hypothetical protein